MYSIRPATADDLESLGRLAAALVREHYVLDPARFIKADEPIEPGYQRYLSKQIKDPLAIILAGVEQATGQVAGYAWARLEDRDWMSLRDECGYLHDIYVAPAHRRHGLAAALLDQIVTRLKEKGAPRIVLHTAARNQASQALFAKAGFRPTMIELMRE